MTTPVAAQSFGLHSAGVQVGPYQPSMDYFKTSIWDFPSPLMVQAEVDVDVIRFARVRVGAGFGQTNARIFRGEPYGIEEEFTYQFIPVSVSVLPHYAFGVLDVYAGAGVDMMNVSAKYTSRSFDTNERGVTTLPHGLAGVELSVIPKTIIALQAKYLTGDFTQNLQLGQDTNAFEQVVTMDGLQFSVGVKFKF
jgi:hypothetical protein